MISNDYLSSSLILQTLQQLRDVYGDSVDKIVQGNAQPLSAKIATPYGFTTMGDIKIGDKVLTPFGTTTIVDGVFDRGVRPVYKITLRDGSTTEACVEHLWTIERSKTNLQYKGVDENGKRIYSRYEGQKTCTTVQEVINTMELKERVDKGALINLPRINPLEYEEQTLPIDPYALGYFIGDAHFDKKGHVMLTLDNKDIEVKERLESLGYELTLNIKKPVPTYYVKNVCDKIRELGLNGLRSFEKYIPEVYLKGSVAQRVALLRGLMDSDGTISKRGEMEFCSSSERLARDVQSLVRSLGGRVALNIRRNVYYTSSRQKTKKQARPAYRLQNIRLLSFNPFMLSRKAEHFKIRTDNSGNRVVSVEYLRDEVVRCIRVTDDRHLYVTDDFIPTHNTSNIVFLKSTDDSMIDTLQKMSGTTHRSFTDSKTVTRDAEKVILQTEGKVSYTMTTREVPVISYNDMAFISERNSIVFRAGDSPIWNRNETILPMSWRLFKNTITKPGKEYTLQTIPTLSSAKDFDVRKNQPDFAKMLEKRMKQAFVAKRSTNTFQTAYGYTDYEMSRLDPDVKAEEIMELINVGIRESLGEEAENVFDIVDMYSQDYYENAEENTEQLRATQEVQQKYEERNEKKYAGGQLSIASLMGDNGTPNHGLDDDVIKVFREVRNQMSTDTEYFRYNEATGTLYGVDGKPYIIKLSESKDLDTLNAAAKDENSSVYAEGEVDEKSIRAIGSYQVTDAFYRFLASLESWDFANRAFEKEMARRMKES